MKLIPSLIPDWRRAWSFASIQVATAGLAWGLLDKADQAALLLLIGVPEHRVPAILAGAFIATRLLAQKKQIVAP